MNRLHKLTALFSLHQPELLRFLVRKFNKASFDAEDIVQDAFHNVLKMENFDSIDNPRAYLFQAASNLALNRIRKQQQQSRYEESQEVDQVNELSPERNVMAGNDWDLFTEAMTRLPQKYRRTFLLSRVESKTYKEISLELGIAESTVEKHIIKTLKYLRQHLNSGEGL